MRGSRKLCQMVSNSDMFLLFFVVVVFFFVFFFFVYCCFLGERGSKEHQNRTIIGLPAERHFNGVSLVGR